MAKDYRSVMEAMVAAREAVRSNIFQDSRDPYSVLNLLTAILFTLDDIRTDVSPGRNYFRLTPITLGTSAIPIVERETRSLTRKVDIGVDTTLSNVVVRVSSSGGVTADAGGVVLNPGTLTPFGELEPNQMLFAVASAPIQIYVIERA